MLKSTLKRALTHLNLLHPVGANESDDDICLTPLIPAPILIKELGLVADPRPVCDYPWWRKPTRIVVTEVSTDRQAWLQDAAPDVELAAVKWRSDMEDVLVGADALIGWCTANMLAQADQLRWIQLGTAGIENILQIPGLQTRELLITNLQRAAGPVIAEHTFAMLLSLARALPRHFDMQKRRKWSTNGLNPQQFFSLHGRTLLVAGLGGIGAEVARLGHAFGMKVIATRGGERPAPDYVDQVAKPDRLREMAGKADVIVNALPLTSDTYHVFDAEMFHSMKKGTLFINVARGASVNTDALVASLQEQHIAGAALDVTDPEPLPRNHPLWRMDNVIITPHVAGWGKLTRAREWLIIKENLRRYVAGEPMLSVVAQKLGY